MDEADLSELLDGVRTGRIAPDDAVGRLRRLPVRRPRLRPGRPPPGPAPGHGRGGLRAGQDARAVRRHRRRAAGRRGAGPVLLTRPRRPGAAALGRPARAAHAGQPATIVWRPRRPTGPSGWRWSPPGTADRPVADECAAVLAAHGVAPDATHRRRRRRPAPPARRGRRAAEADAVVVVAGMEGALASVVGGLTAAPVVAVPTSVGYGASLRASPRCWPCWRRAQPGVTVVGIDNGFGAACAVAAPARGRAPAGPCRRPGDDDRLVPLLLRHRRATWRWAPSSTPAPTWTRSRDLCRAAAGRRLGARGRARPAGRHRRHQGRRRTRSTHRRAHGGAHHRPDRGGPPARPGAATGRWPPSRAGRGRGPPAPPAARARSTSTRSGRSTPSSTSSARAPRSSSSTSTRSTPARWRTGIGMVRTPTACCRTRPRPSWSCSGGRPSHGLDVPFELTTPTGCRPAGRARRRFGGRCRP